MQSNGAHICDFKHLNNHPNEEKGGDCCDNKAFRNDSIYGKHYGQDKLLLSPHSF